MSDPRGWSLVCAQFGLIAILVFGPRGNELIGGRFADVSGAVLLVGGILLVLWAAALLGRHLTPLPAPREAGALITTGPFALVRHPIYVGIAMAAVGLALWSGGLVAILAALALIGVFVVKSRYEERLLRSHFPDYARYANSTLLARLGRRGRPTDTS